LFRSNLNEKEKKMRLIDIVTKDPLTNGITIIPKEISSCIFRC
jgi:hypothetical protein